MTRYEQLQKKIEDAKTAQNQTHNKGFQEIWEKVAIILEIRRDYMTIKEAERMVL